MRKYENLEPEKRREPVWDILKLFAIFLVVWGHSMQYWLKTPIEENPVLMWIVSFHMPLFMVLSGLFASRTFNRSLTNYLKKRGRQLLLPCFSWTLIILVVMYLLDGVKSVKDVVNIWIYSLWFLKSLFVCGLLAMIGFKTPGNRFFWITVSFLISQLFLIWNIFVMYPCFLFGVWLSSNMNAIDRHRKVLLKVSGILFIIFSLWAANSPEFWIRGQGIRAALFSGEMSLTDNLTFLLNVILKRYLQILLGCLGAIFFIVLFKSLLGGCKGYRTHKFAWFGQFTLGVYAIQSVLVELIVPYYLTIPTQYADIFNFVIAPATSLLIVSICIGINILSGELGSFILFGRR